MFHYLSCGVYVEEGFVSDTEGLLGFVNLPRLHLLLPGEDDLFLYAEEPGVEVALAHRVVLEDIGERKNTQSIPPPQCYCSHFCIKALHVFNLNVHKCTKHDLLNPVLEHRGAITIIDTNAIKTDHCQESQMIIMTQLQTNALYANTFWCKNF